MYNRIILRTAKIGQHYRSTIPQGTSLMVQQLRIHLPMQETWVQSLVGQLSLHDATTEPVCCN